MLVEVGVTSTMPAILLSFKPKLADGSIPISQSSYSMSPLNPQSSIKDEDSVGEGMIIKFRKIGMRVAHIKILGIIFKK